jgi:hypothetical protein
LTGVRAITPNTPDSARSRIGSIGPPSPELVDPTIVAVGGGVELATGTKVSPWNDWNGVGAVEGAVVGASVGAVVGEGTLGTTSKVPQVAPGLPKSTALSVLWPGPEAWRL